MNIKKTFAKIHNYQMPRLSGERRFPHTIVYQITRE